MPRYERFRDHRRDRARHHRGLHPIRRAAAAATLTAGAAITVGISGSTATAAPANADQCQYPGVGVGANVIFGRGGFCDFPTEINGSHWHCEAGGVDLGGGFAFNQNGVGIVNSGMGVGGASCSYRCPDGAMAPAPNPPGAWKEYLIPMTSTNYCKDHMTPNGFWSAPVLPTEGIPPVNEQPPQPGETLPPQPVPEPMPTPAPNTAPITPNPPAPAIPGEPNALQPAPGEPNS
jgi:hypothetical protein